MAQPPPKPINKHDTVQVKHLLDDAVGVFFDKKGHEEDHSVTDIRLALGLACCFFAGLAQFYPAPFPDNKIILAICVVSYGICNLVLTYISWVVERQAFLRTKKSPSKPVFHAGSSLPRFTDQYTITLRVGDATVSSTQSIGAFITEDGFLAERPFELWLDTLHSDVQALAKKKER